MADPGWYPDEQDPHSQHYFDGENWTGQRRPNTSAQASWTGGGAGEVAGETVRRGDLPGWPPPAAQPPVAPPPASQPPLGPQPWNQPPQTGGWGQQQPWGQPAQPGYSNPPQQHTPGGAPVGVPPQGWANQPAPTQQFPAAAPWAGEQTAPVGVWQQQPDPGYGQWNPQGPPPAVARKRTRTVIAAGAAVVVVAAGLITWLAWPSDDAPSITYGGKALSGADDTLTTAESALDRAVTKRHGAKNADTRCYFARPATTESGTKKSDVKDSLRCGPVLFVDGQKSADYLTVPLTPSTANGKATLQAPADVTTLQPQPVPAELDLLRPDGKTPPESSTLAVPAPPPADSDLLITGSLGSSPPPTSTRSGVMGARDIKVSLNGAGEVSRYGTGDDARSAPAGQKLVVFTVRYGPGDVGSSGTAPKLETNGRLRPLPSGASSGATVIAAVPASATAQLVLTDGGFRQTLSLPDATPGADNIGVLTRTNDSRYIGRTQTVPVHESKGGASANVSFKATASYAFLDFWAPGNTAVHASSPKRAILTIRINYVDEGSTYGFPPGVLRLRIGGTTVHARDIIASKSRVLNVFDVPADFTTGVLQVTGSDKLADGSTFAIRSTRSWTISIPKG